MAIPLHNASRRHVDFKLQLERRQGKVVRRMALSARNELLLATDPVLRVPEDVDHAFCDLARDLTGETAYNEHAFRYFLANERKRSALSNRPFLLLLVDFQQAPVM